jgi:hypothetical protein
MYCPNMITYTIKSGDTLYSLARYYDTTVETLLEKNPGIDPYNLQIGSTLMICPGNGYMPPTTPVPPIGILPPVKPVPPIGVLPPVCPPPPPITPPIGILPPVMPVPPIGILPPVTPVPPIGVFPPIVPPIGTLPPNCADCNRLIELINKMRLAWMQHIYWLRMLVMCIAERLKGERAVMSRLMQNPADIAGVFSKYYPADVTNKLTRLLTDHLNMCANLVTALRDGKMKEAYEYQRKWYENANQTAGFFSKMCKDYDYEAMRKMLTMHLDMMTKEAIGLLSGNYAENIRDFGKMEKEVLEMADYLTQALSKNFKI